MAVLSESERRLAGTNARVQVSGAAIGLGPGARRCQAYDLPARAHSVRLFHGSPGAGPLAITVSKGGARVTEARTGSLAAEGLVEIRLRPSLDEEVGGVRLCLANRGLAPISLAGDRTPLLGGQANPDAQRLDDEIRVDFLRPGRESWWDLAPAVATRFGVGKASFFGSWTMWAVFLLTGLTSLAAVGVLWRGLRST